MATAVRHDRACRATAVLNSRAQLNSACQTKLMVSNVELNS